ncbi:hypothetical protein M422DRAFT_57721 [Sphaerobolus stellatus SS14]|nr:hypothetical protein M422DRAFT_57721 [Sphaerobolus stellatus SS14]
MDTLIAKADSNRPMKAGKSRSKLQSLPQLQPSGSSSKAEGKHKAIPDYHPHIADKNFKAKLGVQKTLARQRKNQLVDLELLLAWISHSNGRHLAIAGRRGFLASVRECYERYKIRRNPLRCNVSQRRSSRFELSSYAVRYLQFHHHIAVVQARHALIYDQDLVELHRLSVLIEPVSLEFLPYHRLLACADLPGILSYLDTSTGTIMAQHRPKLGPPTALAQNAQNAVIYWGANNGTVSLWTPPSPTPHVHFLAHLGPITAISADPSIGGRYLSTAGLDKRQQNYATPVREWDSRSDAVSALEWSQRGMLAVASAGHVNVSDSILISHTYAAPLFTRHGKGLSSLLVLGAGEPNFDSAEADPFENNKRRTDREVRGILDMIHPDMITLNSDDIGGLAAPSKLTLPGGAVATNANDDVAGETGEAKKERREKREKMKMRGKNKRSRRYLRKKRRNAIDANVIDKQKQEKQKDIDAAKMKAAGGGEGDSKPSALDRFKRRERVLPSRVKSIVH